MRQARSTQGLRCVPQTPVALPSDVANHTLQTQFALFNIILLCFPVMVPLFILILTFKTLSKSLGFFLFLIEAPI